MTLHPWCLNNIKYKYDSEYRSRITISNTSYRLTNSACKIIKQIYLADVYWEMKDLSSEPTKELVSIFLLQRSAPTYTNRLCDWLVITMKDMNYIKWLAKV